MGARTSVLCSHPSGNIYPASSKSGSWRMQQHLRPRVLAKTTSDFSKTSLVFIRELVQIVTKPIQTRAKNPLVNSLKTQRWSLKLECKAFHWPLGTVRLIVSPRAFTFTPTWWLFKLQIHPHHTECLKAYC